MQLRNSGFEIVKNTNYIVVLERQNHKHLVDIQGADIVDGWRTRTWVHVVAHVSQHHAGAHEPQQGQKRWSGQVSATET